MHAVSLIQMKLWLADYVLRKREFFNSVLLLTRAWKMISDYIDVLIMQIKITYIMKAIIRN